MACAVYEIEVTNISYLKLKKLIKNMEKDKERYRYNILGLHWMYICKKIKRANHFYCSEFVYYALLKSVL